MAQQGSRGLPIKGSGILLLAALIGGLGGLLGSSFQKGVLALTGLLVELLQGDGQTPGSVVDAALALEPWQTLLLPAAGGVVAALLLMPFGRDRSPFGIADIVGLVALRKGTIRIRHSLLQIAVLRRDHRHRRQHRQGGRQLPAGHHRGHGAGAAGQGGFPQPGGAARVRRRRRAWPAPTTRPSPRRSS